MDRPFLDANILFSAAYNPTSDLSKLWALPNTELLTSAYAILEAETALTKKQPTAVAQLTALVNAVTIVSDAPAGFALPSGIVLPAQDEPILAAAIHAQATHLLTGDMKHFGPYFGQVVGGVLVLRPAVYLSLMLGGTAPSPPPQPLERRRPWTSRRRVTAKGRWEQVNEREGRESHAAPS